jgi:TnpA family transposase
LTTTFQDLVLEHVGALFRQTVDWEVIERHFEDLMQVALSIKLGKILPSTLLRRLTNHSQKNKLYLAMRELGGVLRTLFLLDYLCDEELRRIITATTNKVESYHRFSKWFFFGGESAINTNDPAEQIKRGHYLDLVADAVIYQNVLDMSRVLNKLAGQGLEFGEAEVMALSPYLTRHIKRFGEYHLDLNLTPEPSDIKLQLPKSSSKIQTVS